MVLVRPIWDYPERVGSALVAIVGQRLRLHPAQQEKSSLKLVLPTS